MAAAYPVAVKTFVNPLPTDLDTNPPHATQHADANDEITAVQTELGVNPSGTHPTVVARLDAVDSTAATTNNNLGTTNNNVTALTDRVTAAEAELDAAPTTYEPIGKAADTVTAHSAELDPHTAAGYVANKVWNGTAWVRKANIEIYTRANGDPDPVADMSDGDFVFVATA